MRSKLIIGARALVASALMLAPLLADHEQSSAVIVSNKLYVYTNVWNSQTETTENKLWQFDGTNKPTAVKDFGSSSINGIYELGTTVAVLVYESSSYKFYVYDPSTGETTEKADLGSYWPSNVVAFNSKLYYTQYRTTSYYLYSFDGSTASFVKDLGSNWPGYFIVFDSKLYFSQSSTLYSYDGTSVTSVKTLTGSVNRAVLLSSKLYLVMYEYASGTSSYSIWSYDGTSLTNVATLGSNYPEGAVAVESKLYYHQYSYSGGTYTYDLYSFDGSTASKVASLSDYPSGLTAYKGRLVFGVWDNSSMGYKLKEFDGTNVNDLASSANPPAKAGDLVTSDSGTWLSAFKVMSGVLYYSKGYNAIWKYEIATIAFSSGFPYTSNVYTTGLDIRVKADQDGKAYYVVLSDGATAPSSAQVKAATDASGTSVSLSNNSSVSANSELTFAVSGLSTGTAYDIYVVAEDNYANIQSSPTLVEQTTASSTIATFKSGYPSVTLGSGGTTATLKVKATAKSNVYYVVLLDGATAPTSSDVKSGQGYGGGSAITSGSATLEAETESSLSVSNLSASTSYDLYSVLENFTVFGSGELQSNPTKVDLSTDVAAPSFTTGYPAVANTGQTSFTVKVKFDEAGTAYYVVLADGATRPDTTKIKAGQDASGTAATVSGNMTIAASVENTKDVTGLTAGTAYDVWVTAEDANGNMTTAKKVDVSTLALPKKLTVKTDGSGDYSTISDAITGASSTTSDTIVVYAGTYTENINFGGKNLVVESNSGPASTIITPANNGIAIVWFYNGEPSTAKLAGFTLKDGGDLQGSAINLDPSTGGTSSSPTIENCIITNSKGYPIRFYNSATVVQNTLIHNNIGDGVFDFAKYSTTSYPEIINVTVANNSGYGIRNAETYKPTVKNSIFWGNSSGGAFGNLSITYSIVEGSYTGTGNKNADPLFMSSTNYDITNYSPAIGSATSTGAPTSDLADSTRGSPPDMGAYENSRATPLTDTTSPAAGTVSDGLSTDIAYSNSSSSLSANWTGFTDAASGIKKYEYAIDTSPTSITGSVVSWTSTGTDTFVTSSGLTLTDGTTYYLSIRATDFLDNVSSTATSNGVTVDLTAPSISATSPVSSTFVNHTKVSYTLSEAVERGTVTWTRTGGTEDANSPHAKSLTGAELNSGEHAGITLTNSPTLVDGAIYTVAFDVTDAAGNAATTISNTTVTYDVTAPTLSSTLPAANSAVNHTAISYTLSEATGSGTVTWTRTGGSEDSNSPHVQSLTGDELNSGAHSNITLTNNPTLVGGAIYTVSFDATDLAGNSATTVSNAGVTYDVSPPEITSTAPVEDSFVNHTAVSYTLSEPVSSATITWTRTGGTEDSNSPHVQALTGDELNGGAHTNITLTNSPSLVDGSIYTVSFDATDEGGTSAATVSNIDVVYDITPPAVTAPREGSGTDDLDFQGDPSRIVLSWSPASDAASGIEFYEFAIGTTAGGTETVPWTTAAKDTAVSAEELSLTDATTYYASLRATDKATNLSEPAAGDGITIDLTPPETGVVYDGPAADIEFSDSDSEVTLNWKGFEDDGSGISHYRVALGTTPGGNDIVQPVPVGDVSSRKLTGLSLNHGATYYCSVMAVDEVDNESETVSSNGFTVDLYPGAPSVTEALPESGIYLSLISDGELIFHFSEPVDYGDVEVVSTLGSDIQYNLAEDVDSVVVELGHPLTSLDTIEVTLSQLTDMSGRVAEDTLFTFYTEMLADYNHDLVVDAADLSSLASGWMSEDYAYELGPVTGEAPHFVPQVDGEYDLRDVMAYTRMWHWYHGTPQVLNLARATAGEPVDVSVDENSLTVIVPESAIAGQIAFHISGTETFLTMPEEQSGEMILLSHSEPVLKQSLMDFAYLTGEGERRFVFPLELGRESSTVTLSYALYGSDGEITGEGIKTFEVTPLPAEFVLDQNYPNPFNPTTRIEYGLPLDSKVNLTVYDLLGQEVRSLISSAERSAGYHNIVWDARDDGGRAVSAGVYIYRISARGENGRRFARTRKMVLLK